MERPALKREAVNDIVQHYGLKLARACRLITRVHSTQSLHCKKDQKLPLRELAQVRLRWVTGASTHQANPDETGYSGTLANAEF